jgi:hypothetical protein
MSRQCNMCELDADIMLPGINAQNNRFFGAYCAEHAKTALRKPKNKSRIWFLFSESAQTEQVTRALL